MANANQRLFRQAGRLGEEPTHVWLAALQRTAKIPRAGLRSLKSRIACLRFTIRLWVLGSDLGFQRSRGIKRRLASCCDGASYKARRGMRLGFAFHVFFSAWVPDARISVRAAKFDS